MWKTSSILAPSTQEFKFFRSWLQGICCTSAKSTNLKLPKSAKFPGFPPSFQMHFAFKHPSAHSKRNVLLKRRAPVQVPQVSLIELQVTTSQPPKWPVACSEGPFPWRINGNDQRQRASCCIMYLVITILNYTNLRQAALHASQPTHLTFQNSSDSFSGWKPIAQPTSQPKCGSKTC